LLTSSFLRLNRSKSDLTRGEARVENDELVEFVELVELVESGNSGILFGI